MLLLFGSQVTHNRDKISAGMAGGDNETYVGCYSPSHGRWVNPHMLPKLNSEVNDWVEIEPRFWQELPAAPDVEESIPAPNFSASAFAFEHIRAKFEDTLGALIGLCECGHSHKDHGVAPENVHQLCARPCGKCACQTLEEIQVFERLGWDEHDNSLEIHDCTPGLRLSAEAAAFVWTNGFTTCYVNHADGWETHYTPNTDLTRPWRRRRRSGGFDVNYFCNNWPKEWLETGYITVIPDVE
jgi:hypothetical protein